MGEKVRKQILVFEIKVDVLDIQSEYYLCGPNNVRECGDINYLTSEALGNLTDFSYKCRYCNTINRLIG
jgi:hypothetical protein